MPFYNDCYLKINNFKIVSFFYSWSYEYESTYKGGSGGAVLGGGGGARVSGSSAESEITSGSSQQGATRYGSIAHVAEGAEETRLIDGEDVDEEEEDVYGARWGDLYQWRH